MRIPTVSKPVVLLLITSILVPGSSIIGHFLGVVAGWLLGMGKLRFMTDPSSRVVLFIEGKLDRLISLIPVQLRYIREADAIELRKISGGADHILPMTELASTAPKPVVHQQFPYPYRSHAQSTKPLPGAAPPTSGGFVSGVNESLFKGEGQALGSPAQSGTGPSAARSGNSVGGSSSVPNGTTQESEKTITLPSSEVGEAKATEIEGPIGSATNTLGGAKSTDTEIESETTQAHHLQHVKTDSFTLPNSQE